MKQSFFICLAIIFILNNKAIAEPGTYYNGVDSTKSCASFKTILANRLSTGAISLPYGDVDFYYNRTDSKPSEVGSGNVIIDRYSSEIPNGIDSCNYIYDVNFCSSGGTAGRQCVCYVKEHVFPSSWFNDQFPMRSEMHLLFPADNYTNNWKSNYPLGYVLSPTFTSNNGTKIGTSNASLNFGFNATHVFEPIDQFKGDFARIYLYMITRYENECATWTSNGSANDVLAGNTYPSLDPWILQLCIKWHKQDPPDAFERKRNDSVFAIQGNRNPYVDYPHWAEKVFGVNGISTSCVPTAVKNNYSVNYSVFPNPILNDLINISIGTRMDKNAVIEVVDVLGRKQLSQEIGISTNTLQLNTSNWEKGWYFINVIYDGVNNVQSIIKQ